MAFIAYGPPGAACHGSACRPVRMLMSRDDGNRRRTTMNAVPVSARIDEPPVAPGAEVIRQWKLAWCFSIAGAGRVLGESDALPNQVAGVDSVAADSYGACFATLR